jgi:hypothetical protein
MIPIAAALTAGVGTEGDRLRSLAKIPTASRRVFAREFARLYRGYRTSAPDPLSYNTSILVAVSPMSYKHY